MMSEQSLTRREAEVARHYAAGASYKAIADQLYISPATVRTHLCTIYRKLEVSSKIELLRALGAATDSDESPPRATALEIEGLRVPLQPRNALIGRDLALAELKAMLARDDIGLLTLTGPGGSGKTRLSQALAADLADANQAKVAFVELAEVRDPTLVAVQIAQGLGLSLSGRGAPIAELATQLRDATLSLVLDNFEQLLPAARDVAELLAHCAKLKIVVTSRAPLQIRGEVEYFVSPLALPSPEDYADLGRLAAGPAVALFMDRVSAVRSDFSLESRNARAIGEICRKLDGLPLALELAAARMRMLDPEMLLERLDRRLQVLAGGPRDLPERQRSLQVAISSSYDLLQPTEQEMFAALSVFAGEFDITAVEAVFAEPPRQGESAMDLLEALVSSSLVRQSKSPDATMRFQLLETLREFGADRLEESGRRAAIQTRHAKHFLALAETADPKLKGRDQLPWLERLDADHANLRAALGWCLQPEGDPGLGLKIAANLCWFWRMRGHIGEARRWIEALLARCPDRNLPRARALMGLTMMAEGDRSAASLNLAYGAEAVEIARECGDRVTTAWCLHALGRCLHSAKELDKSYAAFEESFDLFQNEESSIGCAYSMWMLGSVSRDAGDLYQALGHLDKALNYAQRSGDTWALASTILQLGSVELQRKNYASAASHLTECMRHYLDVRGQWGAWFAVARLIHAEVGQGRMARAAKLAGFEEALRRATGTDGYVTDWPLLENSIERVRDALEHEAFRSAYDEGRAWSFERGIEYALSDEDA